jgi:hypothetical protein
MLTQYFVKLNGCRSLVPGDVLESTRIVCDSFDDNTMTVENSTSVVVSVKEPVAELQEFYALSKTKLNVFRIVDEHDTYLPCTAENFEEL